jgi:hypothetical protein
MAKKKLSLCAAKLKLTRSGFDPNEDDFMDLGSSDVDVILDVAKAAGFKKGKAEYSSFAPNSRARMFYAHLARTRC